MKRSIISVVIIAMFLISGCGEGDNTSDGGQTFIGGTNGLLITLPDGSPPADVFDQGNFPFDVVVKLKNDGETLVKKEDIAVSISGVDPTEFGLTGADLIKHPDDDLIQREQDAEGNVIEGYETYVTFTNFNFKDKISGPTQYTIKADVCYKYATNVVGMLCIKKNILDATDTDICLVKEKKSVSNSGGPLQVTLFSEEPTGKDRIRFQFDVEHKGSGKVFQLSSNCDSNRQFKDKVYVKVDTGLPGLQCSGLSGGDATSGTITLYEGKRTVLCTQQVTSQTDFEKAAKITLEYLYEDSQETEITVKTTG